MTLDSNLELMGQILDIISDAKLYGSQIEKLMNDYPSEDYSIPTENLIRIAASLQLTAKLASVLFEENQTIKDQVADLMRKHAITPKKD